MKLPEDRVEVLVDVGVVKLEVVQDQRVRPVVHELRALVEECRVVLVGLNDETASATETCRYTEIRGNATDQEPGLETGMLEYPRQHARGRGLPVRSGNGEHLLAPEYVVGQPLRPGLVRNLAVEHRLYDVEPAADDIADDDAIRSVFQLRRIEAFVNPDAQLFELRAHGRIDPGIATCNFVAARLGQGCDAAHERAADSEYVYAHEVSQGSEAVITKKAYRKKNTPIAMARPMYHALLIVRETM